jgi:hypothetical protein
MRKSVHSVLLCIQIDSKSMRKGGSCRNSHRIMFLNLDSKFRPTGCFCKTHFTTSHCWTKRELNEFAQAVYYKVNWIGISRNYYRWSRCESTGTVSVWSSSLHSGRQNHLQDWKKWQMLRCEENSYFLWLLWSFALRVCSWRLNSEVGILSHSFTAHRRSSAKISDRNLAVTQLVPWQHSCAHHTFIHSRVPVIHHSLLVHHLWKVVPRPNVPPSVSSSAHTDSVALSRIIWTLLSWLSYYNGFTWCRDEKQYTAGKRIHGTSMIPQKLEIIGRHKSGKSCR